MSVQHLLPTPQQLIISVCTAAGGGNLRRGRLRPVNKPEFDGLNKSVNKETQPTTTRHHDPGAAFLTPWDQLTSVRPAGQGETGTPQRNRWSLLGGLKEH